MFWFSKSRKTQKKETERREERNELVRELINLMATQAPEVLIQDCQQRIFELEVKYKKEDHPGWMTKEEREQQELKAYMDDMPSIYEKGTMTVAA